MLLRGLAYWGVLEAVWLNAGLGHEKRVEIVRLRVVAPQLRAVFKHLLRLS